MARWAEDGRRCLAEFRAEAGGSLGDPEVAALVERLRRASPEFRAGWSGHDIEGFASRERLFHHPRVGDLRLEQHRLTPSDHPDLHVVVYTPVGDGRTPQALAELLTGADGASARRSTPGSPRRAIRRGRSGS